jgi:hypothetical protein
MLFVGPAEGSLGIGLRCISVVSIHSMFKACSPKQPALQCADAIGRSGTEGFSDGGAKTRSMAMRVSPSLHAASLLLALFAASPVLAQQAGAPADVSGVHATPQTENGVSYLTGGIGSDESSAIKQAAGKYNLHLTLSEGPRNAWVSGAKVEIRKHGGALALKLDNAGPLVYVKLPAGSYQVIVDNSGQVVKRVVTVAARSNQEVNFHWAGHIDSIPSAAAGDKQTPVAPDVKEEVNPVGTFTVSPPVTSPAPVQGSSLPLGHTSTTPQP